LPDPAPTPNLAESAQNQTKIDCKIKPKSNQNSLQIHLKIVPQIVQKLSKNQPKIGPMIPKVTLLFPVLTCYGLSRLTIFVFVLGRPMDSQEARGRRQRFSPDGTSPLWA
jgi:hypothetical protein